MIAINICSFHLGFRQSKMKTCLKGSFVPGSTRVKCVHSWCMRNVKFRILEFQELKCPQNSCSTERNHSQTIPRFEMYTGGKQQTVSTQLFIQHHLKTVSQTRSDKETGYAGCHSSTVSCSMKKISTGVAGVQIHETIQDGWKNIPFVLEKVTLPIYLGCYIVGINGLY